MSEAGRAVVHRLQEDGVPYITGTHDVNKPRSGSVMQRLGIQYQYSYQELWQPKDILVTFRMYQLKWKETIHAYIKGTGKTQLFIFIEQEI